MSEPAISIDSLVKDFPVGLRGWKLRAVDHVSFNVPDNAVFGLLGPNGSGKSTAMKIVLGLLRPSAGSARVYGHRAGSLASRTQVGFLPEAPYFYRFLSGREWVRLCGRLSGMTRAECDLRSDAVLDLVDMREASRRRIGTYSKGMLQRIGLAQALVHDPRLLILDEPTAGVDPVGTAALMEVIRSLKERGKTILLCSHLLAQVEGVCDEIAIMNRGRLTVGGRVESLLSREGDETLTLRGLDDGKRRALQDWLAREGVDVVHQGVSRRSLDELFLEQVSGNSSATEVANMPRQGDTS